MAPMKLPEKSSVLMSSATPAQQAAEARALICAYLLAIVVCGLLLSSRLFAGDPAAAALKLILLLVLVLTLYRESGVLLLIAIQLYLWLQSPIFDEQSNWWDVGVVCFSTLALVMLCGRIRVLLRSHELWTWRQVHAFLTAPTRHASEPETRKQVATAWRSALIGLVAGGLIYVALAMLALVMVPADDRAPRLVGLLPSALRAIELACLLMTTFVVVTIFIGELQWRRMSPSSASLFLQSTVVHWLYRDFRLVARRRLKLQRRGMKAARKKSGS